MAHEPDATGPLDYGSDASIDAFATKSCLMWVDQDATHTGAGRFINKGAWTFGHQDEGLNPDHLEFAETYSIAGFTGDSANNSVPAPALYQCGFTITGTTLDLFYDGAAIADTPSGGVGSKTSDATSNLTVGQGGGVTMDGAIGWVVYDDVAFSTANVNRHKWWGMPLGGPGSGVSVMADLLVDAANRGASAASTADAFSGRALPRVARAPGMLMGVGW